MIEYDANFYRITRPERERSVNALMPIIMAKYHPQTIVDVGCGEGLWLKKAKEIDPGVGIVGIDSSPDVRKILEIPQDSYYECDLHQGIPNNPLFKYDLALCLEVAEHIAPNDGYKLVEWLCNNATIIVWSAAIPGQTGVGHINEQWQHFWEVSFARYSYEASLDLRNEIWEEGLIAPYYRQNIIEYHNVGPFLPVHKNNIDVVHPEMWEYKILSMKK